MPRKLNLYRCELERLESDAWLPNLRGVLTQLEAAARDSKRRVMARRADVDSLEVRWLLEEAESLLLHELLGTAFVACQGLITAVVSRVAIIDAIYAREFPGHRLALASKSHLLALGAPTVNVRGYTEVQVVDALTNYFKHHQEWPRGWRGLRPSQEKAAEVLRAVGGSFGNWNNLRFGAQALLGDAFEQVTRLHEPLDTWLNAVREACRAELTSKKLVVTTIRAPSDVSAN